MTKLLCYQNIDGKTLISTTYVKFACQAQIYEMHFKIIKILQYLLFKQLFGITSKLRFTCGIKLLLAKLSR